MKEGPSIIAVMGASASGKSTVAERLVACHGFKRMRFAQTLKDMLMTLGLTEEQVDGPQEIRLMPSPLLCGRSPRHAMQTLGTEWRDTIGKELWSNILIARIHQEIEADPNVRIVIDDFRFLHEAKALDAIGAKIIGVRRKDVEPTPVEQLLARLPSSGFLRCLLHLLFEIKPLHRSEIEWFQINPHFTIQNEGALTDLYACVDAIVGAVISRRYGNVQSTEKDIPPLA